VEVEPLSKRAVSEWANDIHDGAADRAAHRASHEFMQREVYNLPQLKPREGTPIQVGSEATVRSMASVSRPIQVRVEGGAQFRLVHAKCSAYLSISCPGYLYLTSTLV